MRFKWQCKFFFAVIAVILPPHSWHKGKNNVAMVDMITQRLSKRSEISDDGIAILD